MFKTTPRTGSGSDSMPDQMGPMVGAAVQSTCRSLIKELLVTLSQSGEGLETISQRVSPRPDGKDAGGEPQRQEPSIIELLQQACAMAHGINSEVAHIGNALG